MCVCVCVSLWSAQTDRRDMTCTVPTRRELTAQSKKQTKTRRVKKDKINQQINRLLKKEIENKQTQNSLCGVEGGWGWVGKVTGSRLKVTWSRLKVREMKAEAL